MQVVRKAEFFPYTRETLYRLSGRPSVQLPEVPFRAREKPDLMGVFQLYSRTVPANVRAIEGATFREWAAAQESWGGRTTDLVLEEDGIITAWLRVLTGQTGRFSVMARSEVFNMQEIVQAALARLQKNKGVLCLVPQYDEGLARCLERLGFEAVAGYSAYARRLIKPIEELATETAGQAVPVS